MMLRILVRWFCFVLLSIISNSGVPFLKVFLSQVHNMRFISLFSIYIIFCTTKAYLCLHVLSNIGYLFCILIVGHSRIVQSNFIFQFNIVMCNLFHLAYRMHIFAIIWYVIYISLLQIYPNISLYMNR